MKWGNDYFYILLIPFLLIPFFVYVYKQKRKALNFLIQHHLWASVVKDFSFERLKFKWFVLVCACFLFTISLLRPKWGFHWEEVKREGVDIILALDVSKSMLAEDVSPNRIKRAKREIAQLLDLIQGDRVGLIAFAGVPFLQSPLTLDYGAVSIFLDDLDTDLIPIGGTAIADAIYKSIESFGQTDKKSRVLILITDGEDHVGEPLKAAEQAKKDGIRIYTVGIGALEGAPIPDLENGGFKKDRQGNVIMSKLDEETLQKIALETGGSYIRSVSGDLDLEKIYKEIVAKVESKELKSGKRKRFEERFQWPLILALLLLIFDTLYSENKKSNRKFFSKLKKMSKKFSASKSALNILVLLIVFAHSHNASAFWPFSGNLKQDAEKYYKEGRYDKALELYTQLQLESPNDAQVKYNMANALFKMKEYEKAQALYESVQDSDPNLAAKSLYNLGNTAYQMGKLKEAVEYYEKSLAMDPKDEDAQHNLKVVREEIKRRLEEMKKQQQEQQQKNQQSGQDQKEQEQQSGSEQKQQESKEGQQEKALEEKSAQEEKQASEQKEQQNKDAASEKDQQKQAAGKQKEDKSGKEEQKQGEENNKSESAAGQAKDTKSMSKEEAMRWMEGLSDRRKEFLNKNLKSGSGNYSVDKDW